MLQKLLYANTNTKKSMRFLNISDQVMISEQKNYMGLIWKKAIAWIKASHKFADGL